MAKGMNTKKETKKPKKNAVKSGKPDTSPKDTKKK